MVCGWLFCDVESLVFVVELSCWAGIVLVVTTWVTALEKNFSSRYQTH